MKKARVLTSMILLTFLTCGICSNCTAFSTALPVADVLVVPTGTTAQEHGFPEEDTYHSIQEAINQLNGGEILHIAPGTYYQKVALENKQFNIPVTIEGSAEGAVILDGQGQLEFGMDYWLVNKMVVDNITFRNYKEYGLKIMHCKNVTVENCRFEHIGFSPDIDGDNSGEGYGLVAKYSKGVVIRHNHTTHCGPDDALVDQGYLGNSINTYALIDSEIHNNTCIYNSGGGILVEDGINVDILDNNIYGNNKEAFLDPGDPDSEKWTCGGIWVCGGMGIIVEGNNLEENSYGIQLSDQEGQLLKNCVVKNNHIKYNKKGIYMYNLCAPQHMPNPSAMKFEDNRIRFNKEENVFIEPVGSEIKQEHITVSGCLITGNKGAATIAATGSRSLFYDTITNVVWVEGANYNRFMVMQAYEDNGKHVFNRDETIIQIVVDGMVYEMYGGPDVLSNPQGSTDLTTGEKYIELYYDTDARGNITTMTYKILKDLTIHEFDEETWPAITLKASSEITFTKAPLSEFSAPPPSPIWDRGRKRKRLKQQP